MEDKWIASAG